MSKIGGGGDKLSIVFQTHEKNATEYINFFVFQTRE